MGASCTATVPAPDPYPLPFKSEAAGYRLVNRHRQVNETGVNSFKLVKTCISTLPDPDRPNLTARTWTVEVEPKAATIWPMLDDLKTWLLSLDSPARVSDFVRTIGRPARPVLEMLISDGWMVKDGSCEYAIEEVVGRVGIGSGVGGSGDRRSA